MAALDPDQIREQINQAKKDHKILNDQRVAIESRLGALRSYIHASEQMLSVIPGASLELITVRLQPLEATEAVPTNRSIRFLTAQVLENAPGVPMKVEEVLARVEHLGAEIKAKNKADAVHFALIGLRKKNRRFERVGEKLWVYRAQ